MNTLYQSILNISPKSPLKECPRLGVPASSQGLESVWSRERERERDDTLHFLLGPVLLLLQSLSRDHLTFWSALTSILEQLKRTISVTTVTYSYNNVVLFIYLSKHISERTLNTYRTILYLHILLNGTLLRNLDFYHLTFSKTFKSFSKLFPEIGKQTKSFLTWKPTNCKIYNLENQSLLFQFPIKLCVVSRKVSFSFREIAFRKYSFLSLNINILFLNW